MFQNRTDKKQNKIERIRTEKKVFNGAYSIAYIDRISSLQLIIGEHFCMSGENKAEEARLDVNTRGF